MATDRDLYIFNEPYRNRKNKRQKSVSFYNQNQYFFVGFRFVIDKLSAHEEGSCPLVQIFILVVLFLKEKFNVLQFKRFRSQETNA